MKEEKSEHARLQNIAIGWLYNSGCSVFALEVPTQNGIADALGIRKSDVYYIEAKASRSDLICRKQKAVYARATGMVVEKCYYHKMRDNQETMAFLSAEVPEANCIGCKEIEKMNADTGIDFYYFILADGVKIADSEYPVFGVLSAEGKVVRRAKRMKKQGDNSALVVAIAHVLVYKVFGKLYGG